MKRANINAGWMVAVLLVVLVALYACETSNQTPTPSPGQTPSGQVVTVNLVASNMAFDMETITVPAGASVTLNFNNQDSGVRHNFALYRDSSAQQSIFAGQIINGPATVTYRFTAPGEPGSYFFRCDIHPFQMNGTFIVQ